MSTAAWYFIAWTLFPGVVPVKVTYGPFLSVTVCYQESRAAKAKPYVVVPWFDDCFQEEH